MNGQTPTPTNIAQTQQTPVGSPASSPISPNERQKGEYQTVPPKGNKGILFEIIFVLIALILVFGTLNYFNILKLSEIFPNYLGWLPHKEVPTGTSQLNNVTIVPTIKPTVSLPSLKFSCPSVKEFCERGSDVIIDGKYLGWGDKLSTGSAIFAAFDGEVSSSISTVSATTFRTAYLDNKGLGLRATYFLKGRIIKTGAVKKAEQIATASGRTISIYDDKSLIFSVIKGFPATNSPSFLTKEDFE